MTHRVWGLVHRGDCAEASYFVEWTVGKVPTHGAHFDLILGLWGDGTTSRDRFAVSVAFRRGPQGPEFMVIDAAGRAIAGSQLVGTAMSRAQVIGTPVAARVFEVLDQIWLQDERIVELKA
ncbi:MAG: hypothetical protein IT452_06640 [Planctomycetia bacterium]|nr:hypothetical protein [Planctomycetia bacterium]